MMPAATLRPGVSPAAALRLGRAADALIAFALLAVAAFALFDAESPLLPIGGLLLAVTPMARFCAGALTGSGTEIAGSVAFLSCLLRVSAPEPVPARWWVWTAVSGAVLALSRTTRPAWIVLGRLVVVAFERAPDVRPAMGR